MPARLSEKQYGLPGYLSRHCWAVKTVLTVSHSQIPPTLHFKTPHPALELEKPLYRASHPSGMG